MVFCCHFVVTGLSVTTMSTSKRQSDRQGSAKVFTAGKTPCNTATNSLEEDASATSSVIDPAGINVESDLLSPEKLAEYLSKSNQDGDDCPVKKMPDNIMLQIFEYLSVKDLCRAAGVCRSWNYLVRQKVLWRHVDLASYKIGLPNIRKLVFAYFSDSLRSLSLSGFLFSVKKSECVSDALLTELEKRCPRLKELSITLANLAAVNSAHLPPRLSTLNLIRCNYPSTWLSGAYNRGKLDSLQHLDLSKSNGFGDQDLECLTAKPMARLVFLKLTDCYRVRLRGVTRIAENCPNLQELHLGGVPLSNHALQKIGNCLTKLQSLSIGNCHNTDGVMFDVNHLAPLKQLEKLDITQCEEFDGDVMVGLVNSLPKLRLLEASKLPNLTEAHVRKMNNVCMLPTMKEFADLLWMISFYAHNQLTELAKHQAAR